MQTFDVFFVVSLNKPLNKQSSCWWFVTLWRSCDVTVLSCDILFQAMTKKKKILSPTFWILNMVMEQKYINHCPPCWTVQHYCYCLLCCDCMGRLYSCWLLHAHMRPLHLLTRKIISYTDMFLYSYSNHLSLEKPYDIQCGAVITRSIFFKFLTINTL